MGITFAKLFQRLFSKKEMRILMVRYGIVRIVHDSLRRVCMMRTSLNLIVLIFTPLSL